MKLIHSLLLASNILFLGACSEKETAKSCLSSSLEISNKVISDSPSIHSVFVDFDVKNTSKSDYSPVSNPMVQSPIYIEGKVTCTDGSVYNSTQILTVTELKSGNTAVAKFLAEYSTGKTFKDVEIKLVCK